MYFVMNTERDVDFFDTEKEAKEYINKILEEEREDAILQGSWWEDINNICWGKVLGKIKMVEEYIDDLGQDIVDYNIVDV